MILPLGLALVALLAFANGSNDVSKSVATLVGSGVTNYRRALRWGAVWTACGALLGGVFAASLAERFARGLGSGASRDAAIPLAVLIGSLAWVAFSTRSSLPVSTTHAITGAILGAGWVGEGLGPWTRIEVLKGFIVPLLASPLMALALTFLLGPLVARLGRWLEIRCVCVVPAASLTQVVQAGGAVSSPYVFRDEASPALGLVIDQPANCEGRSLWSLNISADHLHWTSSALVSLSRGMNDAPKIWALAFPLFLVGASSYRSSLVIVVMAVTLAMGLGSWAAGKRVTEVLAERVTRMDHHEGFAANLATALLVIVASRLGLPVSTTHVSSGAIVGVGLGQERRSVNWRVFAQMAMAWVVTLPVTAILAMASYWLLT